MKTVAQVALPELKAYGDSMRNFVLHANKGTTEPPVTESLRRIERQLSNLKSEPDIGKLKERLVTATEGLKQSERDIVQSCKRAGFVGVKVKMAEGWSIATSSPQETWQDLIKFVIQSKQVTRADYMETWKLTLERTGADIPKGVIEDETASFKDAGIDFGDVLIWQSGKI